MIRFEKVSFEEYKNAFRAQYGYIATDDEILKVYEDIKLPKRSTSGSAGYDFFAPSFLKFMPGVYQTIPTGIRFVTDRDDIFLALFPRSGLGFKHGFKLKNTNGIIDSDFQYSDNGGHIMVKAACEDIVNIEEGKAFCQGIIMPFLKVDDDTSSETRNGGFGSTDKVK